MACCAAVRASTTLGDTITSAEGEVGVARVRTLKRSKARQDKARRDKAQRRHISRTRTHARMHARTGREREPVENGFKVIVRGCC